MMKKEIKELKEKIAKATAKKKDKKVKKLKKELKLLQEQIKPAKKEKATKTTKYTLINKEAKKQPKKRVKKETIKKVKPVINKQEVKAIIKKRKVDMKKALSAPKVDIKVIPAPPVSIKEKEIVKPKPVYDAVINYGAAKSLETDFHRVGDIIDITDQPIDHLNKKIKVSLGKHTIVPAPGKYLNTGMGVFVLDKTNKPVYIHFPYFKETPFTTNQ